LVGYGIWQDHGGYDFDTLPNALTSYDSWEMGFVWTANFALFPGRFQEKCASALAALLM